MLSGNGRSMQGLTIIEVMIAMIVMAVAILSVLSAVISASMGNRHNIDKTLGMNLAVEKMDVIKNSAYDDITTSNFPAETGITVGSHPISFNRSVGITTTTYKTITVTVTWTNLGSAYGETVELSTIIANTT